MTRLRGVRYLSTPFTSGYQYAAELAMLALLDAGIPVTWTPIDWGRPGTLAPVPPSTPERLRAIAHADVGHDVAVVHAIPEVLPAWRAQLDVPIVCSTAWETTRLPAHWPELLRVADRIIVPSRFNEEVFVAAGLDRVDVVPHHAPPPLDGVEPWPVAPAGDGGERFTFVAIGEWTRRKAHALTVQAYLRAFGPDDPVALLLRTSKEDRTGQAPPGGGPLRGTSAWTLSTLLRRHGGPDGRTPQVNLITDLLDPGAMRRLYRRADAFVSLSRGEGFGLGAFETAAAGTPVIATGFGGHLDYLSIDDALLVDHEVVPVDAVAGAVSYTPDQGWAEPSVDHAAALMRSLVADRADAHARGARLRDRIRRDFSAAATTARLVAVLEQAVERGSPRPGSGLGVG